MKELTIEEKAKAYDKALERAKEINREHSKKGFKPSDDVLYIFPELGESEDERIRKELLAVIDDLILAGEQKERFVAWLEKHGDDVKKIKELEDKTKSLQKCFKTTNDEIADKSQELYALKYAVEKAGYRLDIENLELKKIEQKESPCDKCRKAQPSHSCSDIAELGRCYLEGEQKSAWSKDDEIKLGESISLIKSNNTGTFYYEKNELISFLKSLKDRVQPKPKEWSEEDEKMYKMCVDAVEYYHTSEDESVVRDWLKSFKDRVQSKQEWSEVRDIICKIKTKIAQCNGFNKNSREEVFGLLDSIRLQSQWKPSEEQMTVVKKVKEYVTTASAYWAKNLDEIIRGLEKL